MDRLIRQTTKRNHSGINQVRIAAGKAGLSKSFCASRFLAPALQAAMRYLDRLTCRFQAVVVRVVPEVRLATMSPRASALRCWHPMHHRLPHTSLRG
jgi:hypothetical protein